MDIFTTALSGASTLTAGSAPVSGSIAGVSSFVTLMNQLDPPKEKRDDLLADGALDMVTTPSISARLRQLTLSVVIPVYS